MIPAANGPCPAMNARAGVGTTPTMWTSTPEARRAGGDGRHEHVARSARVLADHDRPAATDQPVGDGPAEGVRERRLQVDVGDAADPVGAEQAGHGRSAPRPRATRTAR